MITVISGGVGAARLLSALGEVVDEAELCAIVNVGDDETISGLAISPDLDTITYTLAGETDPERGWGLRDESWRAIEHTRAYASAASRPEIGWFGLGDRDLGTHMYRTSRLAQGAPLSEVTAEITARWGLTQRLLPATDDRLSTVLETAEGRLSFQEYFVRDAHSVSVRSIHFEGSATALPAPGVIDAIQQAEAVIIAPSNPLISVAPILAVAGIRDALIARRDHVVAVSPIIGGRALKGPADRLLAELGHRSDAVGVALLYRDIASSIIIDDVDESLADDVRDAGVDAVVSPTIMAEPGVPERLAAAALGAAGRRP